MQINTKTPSGSLRDECQGHVTDLLNNHADAISEKLLAAEKYSDEIEGGAVPFIDPDPEQVKMEGVDD